MTNFKKTKSKVANKILNVVKESLEADKAKDIIIITLVGKTDIAENMVIASGRSAPVSNTHLTLPTSDLV